MDSNVKAASVDHDEVNDNVDLAIAAAKKFQFNTANGYLQILLNLLPSLKGALRTYKNTLTSISEGRRDQVLSEVKAKKEIAAANTLLQQEVEKALSASEAPSFMSPDEMFKGLNTESLRVYDKNMDQVQVQLNKTGLFQGYVPILPLTTPPLDTAKLKRHGIVADNFAGYTILKKEFVAGITLDQLVKLIPKQEGKTLTPLQLVDNHALRDAAVEEFKNLIIAKHKGLKLTQMGEPSSWWNAVWIWFAPNSEFRVLKQCTITPTEVSSLKIRKWSFPFNR